MLNNNDLSASDGMFLYSKQISVELDSYVITNVEAHLGEGRDCECLENILVGMIENFKSEELTINRLLLTKDVAAPRH